MPYVPDDPFQFGPFFADLVMRSICTGLADPVLALDIPSALVITSFCIGLADPIFALDALAALVTRSFCTGLADPILPSMPSLAA